MLVVISADKDPVARSDANPDDLSVDTVSVMDKHVAHRNLQLIGLEWPFGSTEARPVLLSRGLRFNNSRNEPTVFDVAIERGTLPKRAKVVVRLAEDDADGPSLQRVSVPARSSVKAVVVLDLPGKQTPGDTFQFSVTQRFAHRMTGGSTYVVRVPPAVLQIGKKTARVRGDESKRLR